MLDNTLQELAAAQTTDMMPPQAKASPSTGSPLAEYSQAQSIPNENASYELYGGTLQGTVATAIGQGFEALDETHTDPLTDLQPFLGQKEDDDGSTYVGDPYTRGGFLDRPIGYER